MSDARARFCPRTALVRGSAMMRMGSLLLGMTDMAGAKKIS